jgi:hypothetical protein
MANERTEVKTVSFEEAVRLVRHSPFERDRRDLITFWGTVVPLWHWSRRTDLTREAAVAYHRSLNEDVMLVDETARTGQSGKPGDKLQLARAGRRRSKMAAPADPSMYSDQLLSDEVTHRAPCAVPFAAWALGRASGARDRDFHSQPLQELLGLQKVLVRSDHAVDGIPLLLQAEEVRDVQQVKAPHLQFP